MLANSSQMVLRNIADLQGRVLVVEPEADQLGFQLNLPHVSCWSTDAAVLDKWQQAGVKCIFSAQPQFEQEFDSQTFDTIVLFYPKSKEQLAFTLQQLVSVITVDSQLYLVGDNKGGIKSLANHASKLGLHAHKLDSAKHCLWFSLSGDLQQLPPSSFSQFHINTTAGKLTICSLPGVFNHGKLDPGTALLLQHLSHISQGTVLDFACGAGIIGAFLKLQAPAIELLCSDISALAVAASKATLQANQLQGTVIAAAGLPAQPTKFNHIVSNPPFHTGLKTDYSISEAFIEQSKQRLLPGGSLTLVANNHLAYQTILEQVFTKVTVLAREHGFVVYQAFNR